MLALSKTNAVGCATDGFTLGTKTSLGVCGSGSGLNAACQKSGVSYQPNEYVGGVYFISLTQHTRVLGSSFRCLDKEGKRPQSTAGS